MIIVNLNRWYTINETSYGRLRNGEHKTKMRLHGLLTSDGFFTGTGVGVRNYKPFLRFFKRGIKEKLYFTHIHIDEIQKLMNGKGWDEYIPQEW